MSAFLLQFDCDMDDKTFLLEKIKAEGFKYRYIETNRNSYAVCMGNDEYDIRKLGNLPSIKDVHFIDDSYVLVSRMWRTQDTVIEFPDGITISRNDLTIVAGPCSVESEEQVVETVNILKQTGVKFMRGGVFKPRSSPYSFRGLGIEGLKFFSKHCRDNNIKVVTEVMDNSQIEKMYDYVDVFQVGARNMQNFDLLDALGKVDKPVLLKRGLSATLDELLSSAEYVFSGGNEDVILCERGVRGFDKTFRNTLDLNAIPYLKEKSHLPVFCDPSHGVGIRKYVEVMAMAAIMASADGILLEIHSTPEKAFSDGFQTLSFNEFVDAAERMRETFRFRKSLFRAC
jgi:3-deoxy-7-phosphoheptulonate synthase